MVNLVNHWYRITPLTLLLWPVSLLFRFAVALRRTLYRYGIKPAVALPVPVIVIGNITVGGTGKTPLVLWLADFLRARDYRPGIISRGYGGRINSPQAVYADSDPAEVGDEPLLLARRSACPVWVGHDRVAAAQSLLQTHPDCDVILSDDGLQHYRLARDMEIALVDAERRFGNGLMLPAGPLREPMHRLQTVDAEVINGGTANTGAANQYAMALVGETFYNLRDPNRTATANNLLGKKLHAVAGIGHPQRFFDHLRALGLNAIEHPFPDHHAYTAEDLAFPDAETILMTEKDAVKCSKFVDERCWVLVVTAQVQSNFGDAILKKLERNDGRKAA